MTHKYVEQKYEPIENYGIIGNLHTVALVSRNASIDFMSFPRFDSPTIFCKLLDAEKGGCFSIFPEMKDILTKQLYLPDTNILVTRFLANEGIAEITDYMPIGAEEAHCTIIRRVITIRGNIKYHLECCPRFNYAKDKPTLRKDGNDYIFEVENNSDLGLRLIAETDLGANDNDVISDFALAEGQSAYFVLAPDVDGPKKHENIRDFVDDTYQETINYWQNWIKQSTYAGRWQETVHRSALTLKLLISNRYGSIVAAPTFSLPESIGNGRNWDYRFTWIRDAAFSMHAFLQLGFMEEAEKFLGWVQVQSSQKELQLMFSVDGNTELEEKELDYLEGYKNSKPVRIGNKASKQTQMDIYGELLETVYIYTLHGGDLTFEYWKIIAEYVEYVINNWQKPDHSIWEVRGEKREFLFSRMMCWVAIDRAIKIGQKFSFPFDMLKWYKVRDDIYNDIYTNFWNEKRQAFVQFKGSDSLDSSALLMPILNIISPYSEKWQKTMDAIDNELRSDVLVYRYLEQQDEIDGLKGNEGTFTMCSFWHVECLALMGRFEEAKEHFEKMLGYANHLGLFAEQLGMKGQHLGNFPQAFTHLALISAAIELSNNKKSYGITQLPSSKSKMK
jgi:GH15 family glucan-1,4-alpha-glucosidase